MKPQSKRSKGQSSRLPRVASSAVLGGADNRSLFIAVCAALDRRAAKKTGDGIGRSIVLTQDRRRPKTVIRRINL